MKYNISVSVVLVCLSSFESGAGVVSRVLDGYDTANTSQMIGDRQVQSNEFANAFGLDSSFTLDPSFDSGNDIGALVMSADPGVGRSGSVVYNNNGAGLDFNATDMMVGGFGMKFSSVDQPFVMQFVMSTYNAVGEVRGFALWAIQVDQGSFIEEYWDLLNFTTSGGVFQFSNIDEIEIRFNVGNNPPGIGVDFVATELTTTIIPAPSSVFVLSIAGCCAIRRQRA